jgi:TonB family protein
MSAFILKLLLNAVWQIPLAGSLGWLAARLLRNWPSAWSACAWRISLLLAGTLPVLTALWTPTASVGGGIHIPVSVAAAASPSQAKTMVVTSFHALRLLWRWLCLRRLNEDTVTVPVAFGWFHPRLILPRDFSDTAPETARRAAIAHETTHIRHRDYAFNLVIETITLPVVFHPLLVWMKLRAAGSVEMRCDEDAAREFNDPAQYALGLIEAARVLGSFPSPHLTSAFIDPNTFEERIMNLTIPKFQPRRRTRLAAVAALAAAGLLVAGLSSSYAAQTPDEKVYLVSEAGVKPPKLLHRTEAKYTEQAKAAKVAGTVVLSLEVSSSGKAENILVLRSLEGSLDQSAIDAVKEWVFRPATKDGKPVRVKATIEVGFKLV